MDISQQILLQFNTVRSTVTRTVMLVPAYIKYLLESICNLPFYT
uniref:Uncharacterized protein n=2 Tax=Anguilla anguilla TaxID=7936 RepID=A0A0E9SL02_ANGAN